MAEEPAWIRGNRSSMRSWGLIAASLLCAALAPVATAAERVRDLEAKVLELNLPAQPSGDALSQVAEAAGLQLVCYSDAAVGLTAPALAGPFDVASALGRLLAQTPLQYAFVHGTIVVRHRNRPAADAQQHPPSTSDARERSSARGLRARLAQTRMPRPLELDEVRVTARRRSEDLQDTPVAVTALSGEALNVRAVRTLDALTQFVPNLQFDGAAPLSGAAYNATIFIRGVGQNDFAIFSDPGVAIYLDGVYLGRSIGGVIDLVDVAQIEVLRGPQGTLFGRNTIGGAVLLKSHEPEAALGGSFAIGVGSLERRDIRATLNVPIDDAFLARV